MSPAQTSSGAEGTSAAKRGCEGRGDGSGRSLPAEIFDAKVNVPLIHQVVVAQEAAARQGTHATKTRGEVRGGGRKPYRQKGTGRARQGSTRAPQFAGGGVVHGPQPRSYEQRTPKKMKAAALRGALSDRARHDRVHVLDGPGRRRHAEDQDGAVRAGGSHRADRARSGRDHQGRPRFQAQPAQCSWRARAGRGPAEHQGRPGERPRRLHPGSTRPLCRPGDG